VFSAGDGLARPATPRKANLPRISAPETIAAGQEDLAFILPALRPMKSASVRLSPLLLTVPDSARRLRRHEQTIRAMIRRGDLAAIRLGRLVRVFAAAVDRAAEVLSESAAPPREAQRVLRRVPARARA
jgi:excisionase family DNA binding protein